MGQLLNKVWSVVLDFFMPVRVTKRALIAVRELMIRYGWDSGFSGEAMVYLSGTFEVTMLDSYTEDHSTIVFLKNCKADTVPNELQVPFAKDTVLPNLGQKLLLSLVESA